MRVTLITTGSLGDARPMIALGAALARAGHSPRIVTHGSFADLARSRGLDFHALPGQPDELLATGTGQSLLAAGRDPLRNLRQLVRLADDYLDEFADRSAAASRGADLIVGSISGLLVGGLHAGEKLGVPVAGAFLQPLHPTREFASIFLPDWPLGRTSARAAYNRISHHLLEELGWQLVRRRLDRVRRTRLGLGPGPRFGPLRSAERFVRLWLYGYSPALLPRPRDWPSNAHVTGYWFLEPAEGWQPPRQLLDFLAAGPPPVYVGFGSVGALRRLEATEMVIEALRMAGQRGVIGAPGQEPGVSAISDDAIAVRAVPHEWLFPRTSLVVHHAGLGTLEVAIRAGRPAVPVPHYMDQPFWAGRLARLGAAARPLPRAGLTAARLAARIRFTMTDASIGRRTEHLARLVGAERGTEHAVALLEAQAGRA